MTKIQGAFARSAKSDWRRGAAGSPDPDQFATPKFAGSPDPYSCATLKFAASPDPDKYATLKFATNRLAKLVAAVTPEP